MPGKVPNSSNFGQGKDLEYPLGTEAVKLYPALNKAQMEIIANHTHEGLHTIINDLKIRAARLQAELNDLMSKPGIVIGSAEVTQTKDEGFDLLIPDPKDRNKKIPAPPTRTIVMPRTTARAFVYYNSARKKYVMVEVMDKAESEKPASLIKAGTFSVTYATDPR